MHKIRQRVADYGARNIKLIICALALVGMIAVSSSISATALVGTALLQAGSVEPPRDLRSGFLEVRRLPVSGSRVSCLPPAFLLSPLYET
jgi:hypothetical protein